MLVIKKYELLLIAMPMQITPVYELRWCWCRNGDCTLYCVQSASGVRNTTKNKCFGPEFRELRKKCSGFGLRFRVFRFFGPQFRVFRMLRRSKCFGLPP